MNNEAAKSVEGFCYSENTTHTKIILADIYRRKANTFFLKKHLKGK